MKYLIKERKRSKSEEMIKEVIEHKPESWLKYEHERSGLFEIVGMEAEELKRARSEGTHKQIVLALAHVAAAAQHALDKMTCHN